MGYVGNQTTNAYSSMDKQVITGNGGANYTLTHAVANAQEIEVFVNNVRQEAGVAYTVSGTALTMTGNVASTDDFYVIYQGKALQTVVPPDGSVTTAKITDANVTEAKLASAVGVLTEYDVWSLQSNTDFSSNDVIKTPVSRATHAMFEKIGTGMSLDSSTGYWTFPSTGFYEVGFGYTGTRTDGATSNIGIQIRTSTDSGSNWSSTLSSRDDISSSNRLTAGYGSVMVKVTNTSTHLIQFRFQTGASSGTRLNGSSTSLTTYFIFKKIKDA